MQERLVFIQVLRACCSAAADAMWVVVVLVVVVVVVVMVLLLLLLVAMTAAEPTAPTPILPLRPLPRFTLLTPLPSPAGPVSCLIFCLCSPQPLPTSSSNSSCPPPPRLLPSRLLLLSHSSPAYELSLRPPPYLSSLPCTLLPSDKHNHLMNYVFLRLQNRN